ncbi:MAG: S8 family serine peptidase [Luteibaculaceae bacterium]
MQRIFLLLVFVGFAPFFLRSQHNVVPKQILCWLHDDYNKPHLEELAKENALEIDTLKQLSPKYPIFKVSVSNDISVDRLAGIFANSSYVRLVQPNRNNLELRDGEVIPDDPSFINQWHLNNMAIENGGDIDAKKAWAKSTGGFTKRNTPIFIGIVDNGYELEHEDLEFYVNPNEIPNNGIDDDNNGFIDDAFGWNAYNSSGNMSAAQLSSITHGTRVAGVVGAVSNNGIGVTGVDWGAQIIPVRGSSSQEATVVEAYSYLLQWRELFNETNGEKGAFLVAVNSSFGVNAAFADDYPIWCEMYTLMGNAGIINIAATSNSNRNVDLVGDIPSHCPDELLIAVASTNALDQRVPAGFGVNSVQIAAPGSAIFTTNVLDSYVNATGNSFAAPLVTGAVSLMWSVVCEDFLDFARVQPRGAAVRIKNALLNEGVDLLPTLDGFVSSGGRLNLSKSLDAAEDISCRIQVANTQKAFSVNPNPITQYFILNPENLPEGQYQIELINSIGQTVVSYSNQLLEREPIKFNVPPLPRSTYVVRVFNSGVSETVKVIAGMH